MSDLIRMMRNAAAEPTEYPDVNGAWRRARLHRAGFVALSLVAVIAVTGGAVIAASSFGESDTRPAFPDDIEPGGEGAIAFSRSGPLGGIYIIDSVDGDPVSVTSTKGDDQPAWSPDGSRIAFVRYEEGNQNIYVMKADGTTTVKLTDDGASGNPTWSPDGARIAFQREMDGNADVYAMNADGTDVTQLTDDPLIEYTPAWSPDGSSIAFVGYSYGPSGPTPIRLYVMNADGSGRRQLPAEDVAQPGWSPDGTKIAFVESQSGSLYVINADGTGLRQVVDLAGVTKGRGNLTMSPSWSPDGTRIAFATGSTATSTHLYLVNEDGSGLVQVTDERVSDANPDWGDAVLTSDADDLVKQLNDAGVACNPVESEDDFGKGMDDGNLAIPHEDAAVCALNNGALLTILVVNDAQRTFDRYFAESHGPGHQLYGTTWIMLVPLSAPEGVVETIRTELHAKG